MLPLTRHILAVRARRAWREDRRLLLLCYGNIWRSAFGERLARRSGITDVSSAGFFPKPGRASPLEAVELAEDWGIDLRDHRSIVASHELLQNAEAIFVFDVKNLIDVMRANPYALSRTHFLGALNKRGELLIHDPFVRMPNEQRAILTSIAEAISAGSGHEERRS